MRVMCRGEFSLSVAASLFHVGTVLCLALLVCPDSWGQSKPRPKQGIWVTVAPAKGALGVSSV